MTTPLREPRRWLRARGLAAMADLCAVLLLGGCGNYGVESGTLGGGSQFPVVGAHFSSDIVQNSAKDIDNSQPDLPAATPEVVVAGKDVVGSFADANAGDAPAAVDLGSACTSAACTTDADCPALPGDAAKACQIATCQAGCCQLATAAEGAACSDGNACTAGDTCTGGTCAGSAASCDDGLACTADDCDPGKGCSHGLLAGFCLIDGACWGDGALSDQSACKRCDAMVLATGWSLAPGCCANDSQCPASGACDVAKCDASTGLCTTTKKMGCCSADSDCNDNNACTTDTCNVQTGACSIVPKSCPAPSLCQKGACDAKTGECGGELKPGYCFVDGACVLDGVSAEGEPCKVCAPLQNGLAWSANAGTYCDDGNACTFSDICATDGTCKGKAQSGCCKSDTDCPASGDPCKPSTCNLIAGLCVTNPTPGCCVSGACCDLGSNSTMPAGAACSTAPLATEFQCSGADIQKRDTLPGCDGASPAGCSTANATQGPWATLQTCGGGTKCVATAGAQMPTCEPNGPIGSCGGSCGTKSANGTCYCDAVCSQLGDCCSDFMGLCGCAGGECCDVAAKFPKAAGSPCSGQPSVTQFQCSGADLQQRTGSPTCDGANNCSAVTASLAWGGWSTVQTCGAGTTCMTSADGSSGSCKAPPAGSCVGYCGTKSALSCWCDSVCTTLGDCCADFGVVGCAGVTSCGASANSCSGACGAQSNTGYCYCDTICNQIGDCCPDKALCGC